MCVGRSEASRKANQPQDSATGKSTGGTDDRVRCNPSCSCPPPQVPLTTVSQAQLQLIDSAISPCVTQYFRAGMAFIACARAFDSLCTVNHACSYLCWASLHSSCCPQSHQQLFMTTRWREHSSRTSTRMGTPQPRPRSARPGAGGLLNAKELASMHITAVTTCSICVLQ